eukprot:TRINITY_DN49999_c0_g1_i1.p1 TRINITY_DN49999_c0_g1~~TRINITY_DN49999_c0_g1_i1.p1  ORF type:complete len:664 (+),score=195.71 TRINITY_DN49999_c0_g1_i1:105-1994(+)
MASHIHRMSPVRRRTDSAARGPGGTPLSPPYGMHSQSPWQGAQSPQPRYAYGQQYTGSSNGNTNLGYSPSPVRAQSPEQAAACAAAARAREESVREIGMVLAELRKVKHELAADNTALQRRLQDKEEALRSGQRNLSASPMGQRGPSPPLAALPPPISSPGQMGSSSPPGAPPPLSGMAAQELASLRAELADKRHENAGLKQLLDDERRTSARIRAALAAAESESQNSRAMARGADQAHEGWRLAEQRAEQLAESERRLAELRRQLTQLQEELQQQEELARARDGTIEELRSRAPQDGGAGDLGPRLAHLQAQHADARQTITQLEQDNAHLRHELAHARRASAAAADAADSATVAALRAEIAELRSQRSAPAAAGSPRPRGADGVLRAAESERQALAEAESCRERLLELERREIDHITLREQALTEAGEARAKLHDAEDDLRCLRDGELVAAKARAAREAIHAEGAVEVAHEARRNLGDAQAAYTVLHSEVVDLRRRASGLPGSAPALRVEDSHARVLLDCWKREAHRILSRLARVHRTNRGLERTVMGLEDHLPPPRAPAWIRAVFAALRAAVWMAVGAAVAALATLLSMDWNDAALAAAQGAQEMVLGLVNVPLAALLGGGEGEGAA